MFGLIWASSHTLPITVEYSSGIGEENASSLEKIADRKPEMQIKVHNETQIKIPAETQKEFPLN